MRYLLLLCFTTILFVGCFSENQKEKPKQIYYFDLKGYFEHLADSLDKNQQEIIKTVSKDKVKEQKKIKIGNWKTEFALFIDADINKSAWKDSYTKDSTATEIRYKTKDPDLKTQSILIRMQDGKPLNIQIKTKVNNLLYHGEETLFYQVGKVYQIKKHQKVILMGTNNYLIEGKF